MMFRGKYLAILLASIGSTQAFSPMPVSRSNLINTNNVKSTSFASVRDFALNVISDAADEVSEAALVVEETEAVVETAEEKPLQQKEEDDITCVAYVVNLSYGEYTSEHANFITHIF